MPQIVLRNITLSHSSLPLIKDANLFIEAGRRICLIGRNGAGKSTLLKLLNEELQPDSGQVEKAASLKIALLSQTIPDAIPGTIEQIVNQSSSSDLEDWQHEVVIAKTLSKLNLSPTALYNELSGGQKRLVLLACSLASNPDVLLLDEPTNHLDINTILLMENLLLTSQKTIIFVTHDRAFLNHLATDIVEIDNGQLYHWQGNYADYLVHKESQLAAETKANALFDKRLAQEEQWIRQGIKARRTRNEGRVRQLKKLREERSQRRDRLGQVNFNANQVELSGKIVFEVNDISFAYEKRPIVQNFSTTILRGDKIGIIGPNGVGKSTLINLLLGNIIPDEGTVKQGTKLTIGYFDQHRVQLDDNKTVFDTVSDVGEYITIDGQNKHVISYLQDFLFSPQQSRNLIKNLSGGERNRVLLAKLFTKPCNLLVLDEPTNDLDVETLELLEERLTNFPGTILLISHDREFLNNVVTGTFVFEENGKIDEFVGGYDDWIMQQSRIKNTLNSERDKLTNTATKASAKLSFKETRELTELPGKIESLEARQQEIHILLADPQFYKDHTQDIPQLNQELQDIDANLSDCYARWEALENRS